MLNQFEELRDTLYGFIETRIGLFEVDTRSYIERIILKLVYAAAILIVVAVLAVFLALLLAVYLNQVLQSEFAGYLIVTGFLILKLALLLTFRKSFMRFIRKILELAFKQEDPVQPAE